MPPKSEEPSAFLKFLVQGSEPKPYVVTFFRELNNLTAKCTCKAGQYGRYCKHRLGLMDGSTKKVVSDNLEQVPLVPKMMEGTDVHRAYMAFRAIESVYEEAKNEFAVRKKILAKSMSD